MSNNCALFLVVSAWLNLTSYALSPAVPLDGGGLGRDSNPAPFGFDRGAKCDELHFAIAGAAGGEDATVAATVRDFNFVTNPVLHYTAINTPDSPHSHMGKGWPGGEVHLPVGPTVPFTPSKFFKPLFMLNHSPSCPPPRRPLLAMSDHIVSNYTGIGMTEKNVVQ